ncbi:hypothetical protein NMY22_g15836 [Coprinellus aureogranulatus]|nr:hypothetical protein NMY22_g15836 [Coprinellus aureogranulatus]
MTKPSRLPSPVSAFSNPILDGRDTRATAHPFCKHNIPSLNGILLPLALPAFPSLNLRLCLRHRRKTVVR